MFDSIKEISNFDDEVLRNTIGLKLIDNYFDDLSDDPEDWKEAADAIHFIGRFTPSELQYSVIDYVFDQRTFSESRFSDGSFPVWYGSTELETTFYETVFHWKKFLSNTPGFLNSSFQKPVYNVRSVFKAQCQSSLIDLRGQIKNMPSLIDKNNYRDTQAIGLKLSKEGFPGVIAKSARTHTGENLAIFNKTIINRPVHFNDYVYQMDFDKNNYVEILDYSTHKKVALIED